MGQEEVIEVNLVDMLGMLCRHWKSIICVAVAGAFLAFGFGKIEEKIQEDTAEKTEVESEDVALQEALLTSYQNRIAANWEQYETNQIYLDNSPLQTYDAENVFQQVDLYEVTVEESQQAAYRVALLQEAYQDITGDARLYDALQEAMGINTESRFMAEVVAIEQKRMAEPSIYAGMQDVSYEAPESAPGVLSVKVHGRNSQECEEMSRAIEGLLQIYHRELSGKIGKHSVKKLTTSKRTIRRTDIVQTRVDKQREMGESLKEIEDLEKKITALEETMEKESGEQDAPKKMNPKIWVVLGVLLGGIAGCAYWGIGYLFDGKMHNAELLQTASGKNGYGLQGTIEKKKNPLEKMLLCLSLAGLPIREIHELAEIGAKELQLAGDSKGSFAVISSEETREYEIFSVELKAMAETQGISLRFFTGDAYSVACLETISEVQGIIWMERKDCTKVSQIRKIKELCIQQDVPVVMNICIL